MEILKEDMTVVEAAAREERGYSLNAVKVEPGKLIATNGKMLLTREIVVEEEEDPFEAFLLEARAFKAAVGKGGFLRPGENGAVSIRAAVLRNGALIPNGTETIMAKHDGKFPEYEHLIPAEERQGQVTAEVDPALMVKLLKAFKGVSRVRISVAGKEALRFDGKTDDGREVVGVLMPIIKR